MARSELPFVEAACAIVIRGQSILIAQRNPKDTFGLYWEFPGGKPESGESLTETVVREIKEETGIDIQVDRFFERINHVYEAFRVRLNFFLCKYLSGIPRPLDCHDVRWVKIEEIADYQFPPANAMVINRLKEHLREKMI
jgi:mutator protein MutT